MYNNGIKRKKREMLIDHGAHRENSRCLGRPVRPVLKSRDEHIIFIDVGLYLSYNQLFH